MLLVRSVASVPEGPLDLCVDGEAPVQTGFCLLTPGVPCCGVLAAGTGMGRFLRRSRLGDQTVAAGVRTADQRLRLGRPGELCKSARGWGSARASLLRVFVGAACSRLLTAVIRGHPRSSAVIRGGETPEKSRQGCGKHRKGHCRSNKPQATQLRGSARRGPLFRHPESLGVGVQNVRVWVPSQAR